MVVTRERAESFGGREVVSFESRRAAEMASLIESYGGRPRVAPSMRELPLEQNSEAFAFGERLLAGEFALVILTTGVGTRYLAEVLECRHPREAIVSALSATSVVARGPKPLKALRDLGVEGVISVPEPNTWREVLEVIDGRPAGLVLEGQQVAVQEYGVSNPEFLAALRHRGAAVTPVQVYRWALPEDVEPLRAAIRAVAAGTSPVLLFTSATQVDHVDQVAREIGESETFRAASERALVVSIGPICSDSLREHGLPVHLEPEHPRMGHLVRAAAAACAGVQVSKRTGVQGGESDGREVPPDSTPDTKSADPNTRTPEPLYARTSEYLNTAAPPWQESPFMRACRREPVPYTPVWLMRQAGRYMQEYRVLRARVPFLELCKNPGLVSEVTVTAAERIGADAAILFADILLVVEPMGLSLEYTKGEGPVIDPPVRTAADVDRLEELDPAALDYVYQAVRQTRADLNAKTPLIGFAGAPFTIASYLIEGGASRSFEHTKGMMYRDPGAWHELLRRISRGLIGYLNLQIGAGAGAVQLFDSWVGCLAPDDYREFVLPHSRSVIEGIRPGTPVIHFGTGTSTLLEDMRDAGGDVIGLDWRVELDRGWAQVGYDRGVQGNLDPVVLLGEVQTMRERARRILTQAEGRPGHIFNLGHGILPQTSIENVTALIDAVHEMSERRP
jgi:uroporphyrinogen decarboxylase